MCKSLLILLNRLATAIRLSVFKEIEKKVHRIVVRDTIQVSQACRTVTGHRVKYAI